jgi:hypothetical protein
MTIALFPRTGGRTLKEASKPQAYEQTGVNVIKLFCSSLTEIKTKLVSLYLAYFFKFSRKAGAKCFIQDNDIQHNYT